MGTDNLHHKRRAKRASDLARRKAKREPYEKVLIVCEGEKTEPNYFKKLKDHLELSSANVMVTGECDSSPISIVDYAIQRYKLEKSTGDSFDKVFCVFDKDSHQTYDNAVRKINAENPKGVFVSIGSVPCFEYWLLLHYLYTTKPYEGAGKNSACGNLISELQNYLPGYEKCDASVFDQIVDELPRAIKYSERSLSEAQRNGTDNPSTYVHVLVEYLSEIKNIR
ncbi:MAG: RloB family protein [Candidatus Pacearchaeota archaeon]|nr:RloB family protein [Candidatus Pacearchaeota archaeon]